MEAVRTAIHGVQTDEIMRTQETAIIVVSESGRRPTGPVSVSVEVAVFRGFNNLLHAKSWSAVTARIVAYGSPSPTDPPALLRPFFFRIVRGEMSYHVGQDIYFKFNQNSRPVSCKLHFFHCFSLAFRTRNGECKSIANGGGEITIPGNVPSNVGWMPGSNVPKRS